MTPNISITLNTLHVTIERYSELTGLPVDVVYCDPPYDGTFSGYHTDGFTEDDQYHLASVLESRSRLPSYLPCTPAAHSTGTLMPDRQ